MHSWVCSQPEMAGLREWIVLSMLEELLKPRSNAFSGQHHLVGNCMCEWRMTRVLSPSIQVESFQLLDYTFFGDKGAPAWQGWCCCWGSCHGELWFTWIQPYLCTVQGISAPVLHRLLWRATVLGGGHQASPRSTFSWLSAPPTLAG